MTKQTSNIKYAKWIVKYCQENPHPFIKDSGKMIAYCFELDQNIPSEFRWHYSDEESISLQTRAAKSPQEYNKIFWLDQAHNIEAYAIMTLWRGIELLKSAIQSLNRHEIIPPSVLSRSLLELATVFLINANNLEKAFRELVFPPNTVVVSPEIEKWVVKMIWGTRFNNPEEHLQQINIITSLKKLSKNPHAKELWPTYEYLCDIAHPSFIGNTRYWSHVEKVYENGSEQRVLSKLSHHKNNDKILDKILWSLGWSAASIRNSFELNAVGLQQLLEKIKKT